MDDSPLFLLLIILNSLSLAGALFVIATYVCFRREYPARLVIFLSIAIAGEATGWLLSAKGDDLLGGEVVSLWCTSQGFIIQYFSVAILLWWLCITVNLFLQFVKGSRTVHYEPWMHIICWGYPLLTSSVANWYNLFQPVDLWCWVGRKDNGAWQWALYYALTGFICVLGGIFWIHTIAHILSMSKKVKSVEVNIHRHVLFVVLYWMVFLFSFVHRVVVVAEDEDRSEFLLGLHIFGTGFQGIMAFLVFGARFQNFSFYRNSVMNLRNSINGYQELQNSAHTSPKV